MDFRKKFKNGLDDLKNEFIKFNLLNFKIKIDSN